MQLYRDLVSTVTNMVLGSICSLISSVDFLDMMENFSLGAVANNQHFVIFFCGTATGRNDRPNSH